jgi:hypothetical protein
MSAIRWALKIFTAAGCWLLAASFAHADGPSFTYPYTVTGTVGSGTTSVTVNGEAATLNGTSFTKAVTLSFGTNTLIVNATDAAGNVQQKALTVYLNLPASQATACCNITVTGTASDNEPDCTVTVSSPVAQNLVAPITNGTYTHYAVPVNYGANTLTIRATDQAGTQVSQAVGVFITTSSNPPTITSTTPNVPTLFTSGQAVAVSIQADDQDGGPLYYRARLGATAVTDWSSSGSFAWTPTEAQFGSNELFLEVTDTTGATDSSSVGVFVAHEPLSP